MKSSKKLVNKKRAAWFITAIIVVVLALVLNFWLLNRYINGPKSVVAGENFTLKIGEEVSLQDLGGVSLKLHNIEDSSCPEDVECIWQGQVYYYLLRDGESVVVGSVLPDDTTRPLNDDYIINYVSGDLESGTFVLQKVEK